MKMYNVEVQTKYHLEVERIDNIEDAGEAFMTEEEIQEITGKDYISHTTYFDKKIKAEIQKLVNKIKKSTANSCKIEDDELVEMFKNSHRSVSEWVKGTRRVGNRLSLHEKAAKSTANKRDGKRFIDVAVRFISEKNNKENSHTDFLLEVRGGMENVHEGAFNFIRLNMTWDEYVKWNDTRNITETADEETMKWRKVMYDDPKYFNEDDD